MLLILYTIVSTAGIIILALNIRKSKQLESMLRVQISEFHESQVALRATEAMLRAQVDEHVRTHEKLTATEEMLRVQLEAVAANERKFRTVFDHSPITAALTNLSDGTLYEVNQSFVDMFGFSREEAIGKSTIGLGIWRNQEDRDRILKILKKSSFVRDHEVELIKKNGERVPVLFYGALLDISGKTFMLSGVMDMTIQRQLEEQVRQQQRLEGVGLLAGGIAHDFSNMLAPIFVYAELIRRKLPEQDANYKRAVSILQAAARAKDLVGHLMNFSRNRVLSTQCHDLNQIITEFSDILRRTIRESVVIDHSLCVMPCRVKADRTQIEQILLNLAVNAQDAISGNGSIRIETGHIALDDEYCHRHPGTRPGHFVMMTVNDDGCGMDETTQSHIFEPFFSTKAAGKGTGLGLATVYGIVKQHNGDITVRSQPAGGTCFRIYLPAYSTAAEQEIRQPARTGAPHSFGPATILLVEDNEMVMEMTRELLEHCNCTVLSASLPENALELARLHRDRIDLLLSDVVMPQMSGPELHGRLMEFMPDLPVLYMSGYTANIDVRNATLAKESVCIDKPFTADILLAGVAKALSQAGCAGVPPL